MIWGHQGLGPNIEIERTASNAATNRISLSVDSELIKFGCETETSATIGLVEKLTTPSRDATYGFQTWATIRNKYYGWYVSGIRASFNEYKAQKYWGLAEKYWVNGSEVSHW